MSLKNSLLPRTLLGQMLLCWLPRPSRAWPLLSRTTTGRRQLLDDLLLRGWTFGTKRRRFKMTKICQTERVWWIPGLLMIESAFLMNEFNVNLLEQSNTPFFLVNLTLQSWATPSRSFCKKRNVQLMTSSSKNMKASNLIWSVFLLAVPQLFLIAHVYSELFRRKTERTT